MHVLFFPSTEICLLLTTLPGVSLVESLIKLDDTEADVSLSSVGSQDAASGKDGSTSQGIGGVPGSLLCVCAGEEPRRQKQLNILSVVHYISNSCFAGVNGLVLPL